jgi:hypothetical protein
MEHDINLAIAHAVDVARARGGRLAGVTLRGHGGADVVQQLARTAFARMGLGVVDVRVQPSEGPVSLVSVELAPRA